MAKVRATSRTVETVPLADLILDFTFYPRTIVDSTTVSRLVMALDCGEDLPPIVADRASKRVVDGFHRVTAYKRRERKLVPVEFRDYDSEADMFLDALRLNASHGRPLTPFDIRHALIRCIDLGIEPLRAADVVHVPPIRVTEMIGLSAQTKAGTRIPLKRGLSHLAGRVIDDGQAEVNRRYGGMRPSYYVVQLIGILRADMWDREDVGFRTQMDELCRLWLAEKGPSESTQSEGDKAV